MLIRVKQFSQSKFVRNVAIVATGTAGAQAIAMAFAPVITRLYGPEAFGLLGTFLAILGVVTPIAALTYPIAIVLQKSDADAKNIAKLSALLATVVAAISAVLFLLVGDIIAYKFGLGAVSGFLLLIPVAIILSAFQQIFTQSLIREKQFKITARVAILQAIIMNSSKVGVGLIHPVGTALIMLAVLGQAIHTMLLWVGSRAGTSLSVDKKESSGTLIELARRHKDFPFYRAPQVALNALTQGLPVLVLAGSFGPATAGFFALTKSVLTMPAVLVGQSVGNVFYPRAVELFDKPKELKRVLLKSSGFLFVLGVGVFSPVIIAGPWMFSLIFGVDWIVAGELARLVAIWMVFSLAARPAISSIPVLGLQKAFLIYEIIFLPLKIIFLYVGYLLNSPTLAVGLYSVVSSLFYILLFLFVWRKISLIASTESARYR